MKRYALALLIGLLPAVAGAQANPAAQAARLWRQQHERAIVDEFVALLSIPTPPRCVWSEPLAGEAIGGRGASNSRFS